MATRRKRRRPAKRRHKLAPEWLAFVPVVARRRAMRKARAARAKLTPGRRLKPRRKKNGQFAKR